MEQLNNLYPQLLNKLKTARDNHSFFCTNFLKIIIKEGKIVPFLLNNIQLDFLDKLNKLNKNRYRKLVILKARQFGMSTFIESLFFRKILDLPPKKFSTKNKYYKKDKNFYSF